MQLILKISPIIYLLSYNHIIKLLRLFILPFVMIILALVPSYANLDTSLTKTRYSDMMINTATIDINEFKEKEKKLADELFRRIYDLYPDSYHQKRVDEILNYFAKEINKSPVNQGEQNDFYCANELSKLINYKQFVNFYEHGYVKQKGYDRSKKTLETLNYFFVDEVALAKQSGNINKLGADFYKKLEYEQLTNTFEAFMNDLEYEDEKFMAGLDLIEKFPYSLTGLYFIVINIEICKNMHNQ